MNDDDDEDKGKWILLLLPHPLNQIVIPIINARAGNYFLEKRLHIHRFKVDGVDGNSSSTAIRSYENK